MEELERHMFLLRDRDATQHLMEVSGGLDSLIKGEGQILAQVFLTLSSQSRPRPPPLVHKVNNESRCQREECNCPVGVALLQCDVSVYHCVLHRNGLCKIYYFWRLLSPEEASSCVDSGYRMSIAGEAGVQGRPGLRGFRPPFERPLQAGHHCRQACAR